MTCVEYQSKGEQIIIIVIINRGIDSIFVPEHCRPPRIRNIRNCNSGSETFVTAILDLKQLYLLSNCNVV